MIALNEFFYLFKVEQSSVQFLSNSQPDPLGRSVTSESALSVRLYFRFLKSFYNKPCTKYTASSSFFLGMYIDTNNDAISVRLIISRNSCIIA